MFAAQIIGGLERSTATGPEAEDVARAGFLQWALAQDGGVTAADAMVALQSPPARHAGSDAAQAFVRFLEDAAKSMPQAMPRRRPKRSLYS